MVQVRVKIIAILPSHYQEVLTRLLSDSNISAGNVWLFRIPQRLPLPMIPGWMVS